MRHWLPRVNMIMCLLGNHAIILGFPIYAGNDFSLKPHFNLHLLGRQWLYQTCTEFGFYQTSDSNKQPFGSLFPLRLVLIQWYQGQIQKY